MKSLSDFLLYEIYNEKKKNLTLIQLINHIIYETTKNPYFLRLNILR